MTATFTALLLAHLLADFVLQPGWMAARKRHPGVLLLHVALVLALSQAALGHAAAWPVLALAGAHLLIDTAKAWLGADGLAAFILDQAAHLSTIAGAALLAPQLWEAGLWAHLLSPSQAALVLHGMALGGGLLVATRMGGFAVGKLMAPYQAAALPAGLKDAGRLIGYLERGLIFVLLLGDQPEAIGFLLAAKSILRFDPASRHAAEGAKDHRAAEYVIIGTLASFGWALAAAAATDTLTAALPALEIAGHAP